MHEMYTQLISVSNCRQMLRESEKERQACKQARTCTCTQTYKDRHFSHLGGFDFVASAAGPASQVRQDLTLLSIHTRMHLAPPLLGYDGGWSSKWRFKGKQKDNRLLNGYHGMMKCTELMAKVKNTPPLPT